MAFAALGGSLLAVKVHCASREWEEPLFKEQIRWLSQAK